MKMLNLSIITAAIIGAVSVNAANQTTTIYQTGNGNSADALQSSSNSVLIDVTQKGTKNSSTSTQIGASKSDTVIYQSGSFNSATTDQTGTKNDINIEQRGKRNDAQVDQSGYKK
ncbi:hypothetical protein PCI56_07030 [Plesiomonas shigelloides subsp. oncorhynchi]|nr:hypothetical protein [Plesiomonas shigelloides]